MNVPEGLLYSTDHEWVLVDGDAVKIGITDHAQDALGDIVYIDLPAPGSSTSTGASFGEIESTKSVSDIYSPVNGEVVDANAELEDTPELVNQDPYGEGWMIVLRPSPDASFDHLMDPAAYAEYAVEE